MRRLYQFCLRYRDIQTSKCLKFTLRLSKVKVEKYEIRTIYAILYAHINYHGIWDFYLLCFFSGIATEITKICSKLTLVHVFRLTSRFSITYPVNGLPPSSSGVSQVK